MPELTNTHLAYGIRFSYPEGWLVTEEHSGDDTTLTASDDGNAQWSVTLIPDRPDPALVLKQVLQAFQEDYGDVDVTSGSSVIGGHEAEGADLYFECLEMPITAGMRAFRTEDSTFLVLYQTANFGSMEFEDLFELMNKSFACDS